MRKLTDKLIALMVALECREKLDLATLTDYRAALRKAVTILDRLGAFTDGVKQAEETEIK